MRNDVFCLAGMRQLLILLWLLVIASSQALAVHAKSLQMAYLDVHVSGSVPDGAYYATIMISTNGGPPAPYSLGITISGGTGYTFFNHGGGAPGSWSFSSGTVDVLYLGDPPGVVSYGATFGGGSITWDNSPTAPEDPGVVRESTTLVFYLKGGPEEPCPDRVNQEFTLAGNVRTLTGNRPASTIEVVLKVNGQVRKVFPAVSLPGGSDTVPFSYTYMVDKVPGAASYSWEVNGVEVAAGSYNCSDETPTIPSVQDIVIDGSNNPGESETEQESTDPQGNQHSNNTSHTPPTPPTGPGSPSGPPGTVPGTPQSPDGGNVGQPGGTTYNNHTTVNNSGSAGSDITNQDIYNDVLQALKDAGKSGYYGNPSNTFQPGDQPEGVEEDQTDDLSSKADDMRSKGESVVDKVSNVLREGKPTLPTSVGKTWSYNLALPVLGAIQVDFTQYSGPINVVRTLMLAVLLLMGWTAGVRLVGWAFAN